MKISHRMPSSEIDWTRFKYMVFDAPHHDQTYETRYSRLGIAPTHSIRFTFLPYICFAEEHFANRTYQWMELAPKVACKNLTHLEKYFQDILDRGGEGIILRDPKSPYEPGRSRGYVKHKVYLSLLPPPPRRGTNLHIIQ